MDINTGISADARREIVGGLSRLLADSYTLYLKTHNYHWNVTGPHFNSLHDMFEAQYTELAAAVDLIAERIRALGEYAPGTYSAYSKLTSIEEGEEVPAAMDMVADLVKAHETVCRTAREVLPKAEDARDEATVDLLTQRLDLHEKTAWMLRSLLA